MPTQDEEHMTMKQIRAALETVADSVGRSKGDVVVRRGFFYKQGMTSEKFAEQVNAALEKVGLPQRVVACGEKWAPFRGGQTVAQGSHFWARIA
jgi:hypothetical protein